MASLDYKKMVDEIDKLVETDFCFDMDCKTISGSTPYTQKEATEMAMILGQVYLIAHCINCEACQSKYLLETKS